MDERMEIIKKAVLERLSEGVNFFTAEDILIVAGIDDNKLHEIAARLFPEEKGAAKNE